MGSIKFPFEQREEKKIKLNSQLKKKTLLCSKIPTLPLFFLFRLPFFIFERFSTSGRRKWHQFHQVVPSSPLMITIEVSDLVHAFIPNGYNKHFSFSRMWPSTSKSPFYISNIFILYFRAPWICLQQQFLWKCGVHGRSHSSSPRYPEFFCLFVLCCFFFIIFL